MRSFLDSSLPHPLRSKRDGGKEVITSRSAQNSALLRLVSLRVPEQVPMPVPRPLLGLLSVSEPLPEPLPGSVSVSAYSLEQRGRLYILSH